MFKLLKKPMANPILMTQSSAMPYQVKRASLAQEALRRLLNTSRSFRGPGNGREPKGRRRGGFLPTFRYIFSSCV